MSSLIINNLKFFSFIGVNQEEKDLGQWFACNCEIYFDFLNINDKIENTVNYSEILKMITAKGNVCKYNLIETFADEIANEILKKKIVKRVIVEILKPNAPLKVPVECVSVKVDKSSTD
jgi:dihydroneopterin aldolase